MKEKELQKAVIDVLHHYRWKVSHFHAVPVQRGATTVWMTPAQADGKGFPDLVAVRERLIVVELKLHGKQRKPEQVEWAKALELAGVEYHLWTDRDYLDGLIDRIVI